MNPRITLPTIGLLAVIALSACAPAATASPSPAATAVPPTPAQAENPPAITEAAPSVVSEAPTVSPQVVATSRGPNLEATDPASVSLASGGLQLVEFFRFT
ncbi:MAG: hypothetical protein Fur0043_26960 [Anaerolineales bacterium]